MSDHVETEYGVVPSCRIEREYPIDWSAASEPTSDVSAGPDTIVVSQTKTRATYSNKLIKQLKEIGVDIDEETGEERVAVNMADQREQLLDLVDLESIAAETEEALAEGLVENEDAALSDWDPMKTSFEQKCFNTYGEQPYNANFTEKHKLVNGPDGYKISPTKGGSEDITLYVSNIPLTLSEDGMRNMFSSVGNCKSVRRCKSKYPSDQTTFGFVVYSSVRDAEKAIKTYNGFLFGGKYTLRVRLAQEKPNTQASNGLPQEKIIWDKGSLLEEQGTPVTNGNHQSSSSDDQVVQNFKYIPMKPVSPKEVKSPESELKADAKTRGTKPRLYIQGLPVRTSDSDLKRHFDRIGPTYNCIVTLPKKDDQRTTFGFVSYDTFELCDKAIDYFHNSEYGGKKLSVSYSHQSAAQQERPKLNEEELFYQSLYNDLDKDPFVDTNLKENNKTSHMQREEIRGKPDKLSDTKGKDVVEETDGVCVYCELSNATSRCSRCKALYCNRLCQSKDWPYHKVTCRVPSTTSVTTKNMTTSENSEEKQRKPSCSDAIRGMDIKDLPVKPYPDETEFQVCCTEVVTPHLFYAQLISDDTILSLQEVTSLLHQTYEQSGLTPFVPKVNEVCVAKFQEDQCWYRASVVNYNSDMTARVFFIDFGNKADVDTNDLRCITEKLLNYPRFALSFSLHKAKSKEPDGTWSYEVIKHMKQCVVNQVSLLRSITVHDNIMVCDVLINDDELLLDSLKKNGYCAGERYMTSQLPSKVIDCEAYEAIVVNAENPNKFHAWLGDLNTIQEQVQTITATLLSLPDSTVPYVPLVGELCALFHEEFNEWYRADVTAISGDNCTGQLIDYGNEVTVHSGHVRLIRGDNDIINYPAHAVKLSLGNVSSSNGDWTNESISLFKEQVEFKKGNCVLVKKNDDVILVNWTNMNGEDVGEILKAVTSDDKDVADILITNDLAAPSTPHSFTQQPPDSAVLVPASSMSDRLLISNFPQVSLPSDMHQIFIANVESPGNFQGQIPDAELIQHLDQISMEMTTLYKGDNNVYTPVINEVCVAFFSAFELFYRVKIDEIAGDKIHVTAIDYGNKEIVDHVNIKPLPKQYSELPAQAVYMSLYNAVSTHSNNMWSKDCVKYFVDKYLNKLCDISIKQKKEGVLLVGVSSGEINDAKADLVAQGFAVGDENADVNENVKITSMDDVSPEPVSIPSSVASNRTVYGELQPVSNRSAVKSVRQMYDEFPKLDLPLSSSYKVAIVNVESPSNFQGQVADAEIIKKVDQISVDMTSLFKDDFNAYMPVTNEVCAAFLCSYDQFFRVKINQIVGDKVHVIAIDHGNKEIVSSLDIKPLPKQYSEIPAQAVYMSLYNAVSASSNDIWPNDCTIYFIEKYLNQLCNISIKQKNEGILLVDLSSGDIKDAKADLVAKGFAVGDEKATVNENENLTSMDDDLPEPVSIPSLVACNRTVYDEFPKLDLPHDTNKVLIVNVESPVNFQGQIPDAELIQHLDQISMEMTTLYKGDNNVYTPVINEVCVAFFSAFEMFFRVKIDEIAGDKIHVTAIDYGNKEIVDRVNIKPLRKQHSELPAQAVYMSLYNAVSTHSNNMWSKDCVAYFIDKYLNKLCNISIKQKKEGELLVGLSSGDINDAKADLVAQGFAVGDKNADVNGNVNITSMDDVSPEPVSIPSSVASNRTVYGELQPVSNRSAVKSVRQMYDEFPKLDLPLSSSYKVAIVNVESPSNFQGQVADAEIIKKVDQISVDMTSLFKDDFNAYMPVTNEVCAAFLCSYDQFFRVKIDQIVGDKVHVIAIDHGNKEIVSSLDIKPLPKQYSEIPAQAVYMSLYNAVSTSSNDMWSNDCTIYFIEKYLNQLCDISIKQKNEGILLVDLSSGDINDATADLVAKGFAVGDEKATVNENENLTSMDDVLPEPVSIPSLVACNRRMYDEFPKLDLPHDTNKVLIVNVESPGSFQGQIPDAKLIQHLDQISMEMTTLYKGDNNVYTPVINEVCVAFFSAFELFYRVKIDEIAGDKIHVTAIDYGNKEIVDPVNIKPLPKHYSELPAQAVYMSLYNAVSTHSNNMWSKDCVKYFVDKYLNKLCDISIKQKNEEVVFVDISAADGQDVKGELVALGYVVGDEVFTKETVDSKVTSHVPSVSDQSTDYVADEPSSLPLSNVATISNVDKEVVPKVTNAPAVSDQLTVYVADEQSSLPLSNVATISNVEKEVSPRVTNASAVSDLAAVSVTDERLRIPPSNTTTISNVDKKFPPKETKNTEDEARNQLPPSAESIVKDEKSSLFTVSSLPSGVNPLEAVSVKMNAVRLPAKSEVYVKHIVSPYLTYAVIADADCFEEVDKISKDLLVYFEEEKLLPTLHLKAGTLCAVKENKGKWHRAVVTDVTETNATVFAFDQGFSLTTTHDLIKVLDRRFKSLPAQVIPLKLATVAPKDGATEWSDDAIEYFRGMLDGQTLRILTKFKEGLILNVRMKLSLNGELVESLFESGGYATVCEVTIPKDEKPAHFNSLARGGVPFEAIIKVIPIQVAPSCKEFDAVVTCTVSPRLFYVQLYNEANIKKVDKIGNDIMSFFEGEDLQKDLIIGELCSVKYMDNLWYRGFVLELRPDSSAIVYLIDYGIKWDTTIERLRMLPEKFKNVLPSQALTMQLQFVTPRGGAKAYSKEAMRWFSQRCELKLMKFQILKMHGYIHRVKMFDEHGADICQELVSNGYADFIYAFDRRREKNTFQEQYPDRYGPPRRPIRPCYSPDRRLPPFISDYPPTHYDDYYDHYEDRYHDNNYHDNNYYYDDRRSPYNQNDRGYHEDHLQPPTYHGRGRGIYRGRGAHSPSDGIHSPPRENVRSPMEEKPKRDVTPPKTPPHQSIGRGMMLYGAIKPLQQQSVALNKKKGKDDKKAVPNGVNGNGSVEYSRRPPPSNMAPRMGPREPPSHYDSFYRYDRREYFDRRRYQDEFVEIPYGNGDAPYRNQYNDRPKFEHHRHHYHQPTHHFDRDDRQHTGYDHGRHQYNGYETSRGRGRGAMFGRGAPAGRGGRI